LAAVARAELVGAEQERLHRSGRYQVPGPQLGPNSQLVVTGLSGCIGIFLSTAARIPVKNTRIQRRITMEIDTANPSREARRGRLVRAALGLTAVGVLGGALV